MMLREDPNLGWIHWAHPSGRKEASSAVRSADACGFVAQSPAHDFPQRVIYRRVGPEELLARIEGRDISARQTRPERARDDADGLGSKLAAG